jgi:hypothetical protein
MHNDRVAVRRPQHSEYQVESTGKLHGGLAFACGSVENPHRIIVRTVGSDGCESPAVGTPNRQCAVSIGPLHGQQQIAVEVDDFEVALSVWVPRFRINESVADW